MILDNHYQLFSGLPQSRVMTSPESTHLADSNEHELLEDTSDIPSRLPRCVFSVSQIGNLDVSSLIVGVLST